jgi:hypothetical protein
VHQVCPAKALEMFARATSGLLRAVTAFSMSVGAAMSYGPVRAPERLAEETTTGGLRAVDHHGRCRFPGLSPRRRASHVA